MRVVVMREPANVGTSGYWDSDVNVVGKRVRFVAIAM